MKLLEGKTAIITGGGGGLGRSYGVALAKAGALVAVSDVDFDAAQATADAITQAGGEAMTLKADVTRAAEVEKMIDRAERELGTMDIMVNLAGIFPKAAVLDLTEDEWDTVIGINLKSVFLCSRAAIHRMLPRKRGVVLSAASGTAWRGVPQGSAYVASKAAIIGFTRAVSLELKDTGVRINCFAPGATDTALWREGKSAEDVQRSVANRTVFDPDAFSNIVVYLASDLSWPLNGEFVNREQPR